MMVILSLNLQTILIGLCVLLIVYKIVQRIKYKQPPGPFAIPLIGNYEVIKSTYWFKAYAELAKKYGPVLTAYLGPFKCVILSDITVVTEALIKKKADFAGRPNIHSVSVITEGNKDIAFGNYSPTWKLHRRIVSKAFRQYLMGNHLEKIVHKSMTKCLDKMAEESGPFNPERYIDLMVFNILHSFCFGRYCDLDDPEFLKFMRILKDTTTIANDGFIEDMMPILAKICPSKKYKSFVALVEELNTSYRNELKEHERTFDPDSIRDFTDAIILARKEAEKEEDEELLGSLTETHLVQTIADVFGAGIDTSRITLYYAVRYITSFQDIQAKMQEELDKVVGKNRLPGMEDRENLGYCEATLHESMRVGMAGPLGVPHKTLCDTSVGGYDIPKGTMVMINHWALHHDPKYWKDAEKFDPNRFLTDDGKLAMRPESWLPFSAGRRVCLGEIVAKPELHMVFSSIFHRFKITLPDGTDSEIKMAGSRFTMQPAPFEIVVSER